MKHSIFAAALALGLGAGCAQAQDDTWRPLDPENTLVLEIAKAATTPEALLDGPQVDTVVIEFNPEFAPGHVARIKQLVRSGFYDGRVFHRVIEGFMAQGGGLPGNPQGGDSGLPDLQAEFTARLGPEAPIAKAQDVRVLDPRTGNSPRTEAGFLNGFPVGYQPAAQTMISNDGKRDVWVLHCPGTTSMARTAVPDSANFQFYLMRGESPWLDASYTAWGKVRDGLDAVYGITEGEPPARPDTIRSARIAADLPEAARPSLEVMRTESEAFAQIVADARTEAAGDINACDIEVPVRMGE